MSMLDLSKTVETLDKFGKRVGEFKEFFDNGNIYQEGFCNQHGIRVGNYKRYYENGQLELDMNYSGLLLSGTDGDSFEIPCGKRTSYYANGVINTTGEYDANGNDIGTTIRYNPDGTEHSRTVHNPDGTWKLIYPDTKEV